MAAAPTASEAKGVRFVGRHAQTVNLAPSQGGRVEFTLDEEGTYPFVTHAFGDMVKGSVGVLATEHAPGAGVNH